VTFKQIYRYFNNLCPKCGHKPNYGGWQNAIWIHKCQHCLTEFANNHKDNYQLLNTIQKWPFKYALCKLLDKTLKSCHTRLKRCL
jgi:ribosomal protein L37AE/L43A